jgi:hypothetical protein
MPKRLIFDSSVWRRIRSFVAAPHGPEILPRDSASDASMIAASCSAKADSPSRAESRQSLRRRATDYPLWQSTKQQSSKLH